MPSTNPSFQSARIRAAQLLEDVLDEKIVPQLALNRWPESGTIRDLSLDTAYQALWYFEADEDRHHQELFYLDAQLELLRQMAVFLKSGQDFPPYLLKMYAQAEPIRFYYHRTLWEDTCHLLEAFKLHVRKIWQDAFALIGLNFNQNKSPL